ncbi:MAG: S46 family peptidase [Dysgonamonadaceae bacterium]|jgi:hypothetical protein|nr:S46 family peptidase [Dysgonamonadaceae bacterium]
MKKITCLFLGLMLTVSLFADEGMWMLNNLKQDNWVKMRSLGFVMPERQLYDPDGVSLKDAVVHFNGGCTGITVSDLGLIFTNHHCGYGAIQSQSTVEHDYLKDGFVAQTLKDEIPISGMYVRYLLKTEDFTWKILSQLEGIKDEAARLKKINEICTTIEDSVSGENKFIEAHISSYFANNSYYLNVYEVFNDIRLVFAPPSSVGKFGGDTDNWMWPRHTGDFSIFRVYAGTGNSAAEYSESNVPYKPKYVSSVSLKGYESGSYCMTIGFPGRTNRYLSSWGIRQRVLSSNEPRIEVRGIKQDIWKEAMLADADVRIKYSSKYAGSSNYWKNSIGMNRGVERLRVIERKQALERQFENWIKQDTEKQEFYGEALELVKTGYESTDEIQKNMTYLSETMLRGAELIGLASLVMQFDRTGSQEEMNEKFEEDIVPEYKNYNPELDRKVFAAMLKVLKKHLPAGELPSFYKVIDKKYKGDCDKYAAYVFDKSVIPHIGKLKETILNPKNIKKIDKDPAYELVKSVREVLSSYVAGLTAFRYDILKGERLFFAGLQQMMPGRDLASDANSTMRLSYGSVGGYVPYDGAWYEYNTTTAGVFEKYKKNDSEFDVQQEILDLLSNKDFGAYGNGIGDMNLCFLSNNDITGGNSGSPMFNGNGEVIGLAFDGNWEAMSGDIVFEPELQRTIGVDIRYVMYMIDKWGKCNRLLEEIKVK